MSSEAREAGGSIKPGAQAPGHVVNMRVEPAKRAAALSPASRAYTSFLFRIPGACAPGFMLSPASQVKQSWAGSLAVLGREDEAKDHVPEIARIGVQRVEPVLESDRVRVAPQITKVLHRHKRTIEELICDRLVLDDVAQHLAARHLSIVECRNQRPAVRDAHFSIRLERKHIL